MKLDYFTLLCPEPISLSIGTIRQPTLRDIGRLTFQKFGMYQVYLKLTPHDYFMYLNKSQGESYWDTLQEDQQNEMTLYDLILLDKSLLDTYIEILNFFFVERVIFKNGLFLIVDEKDYSILSEDIELNKDNVRGVINPLTLNEILDIIQQICCIKSDNPFDEVKPKFKNNKARRLYERMLKAKAKETDKKVKKDSKNMSLPNIISATAAKNAGLNIINIWDATLFQLYDQFEKTQNDVMHYMDRVHVAVWGDEKNQFNPSLWYKNNFDK